MTLATAFSFPGMGVELKITTSLGVMDTFRCREALAREYLTQRIRRLEQAEQGLAKSSAGENHLQSRELGRIKQALIERRAQL